MESDGWKTHLYKDILKEPVKGRPKQGSVYLSENLPDDLPTIDVM